MSSFGVFGPRFTIEPDRVTIARNAWLPPLLLLLLAPGIYCIVQAFQPRELDTTMFAIGLPCVLAGLFALVATPWLMPAKIDITRDGVVWGGKRYPREAVISAKAVASTIQTNPYQQRQSWSIVIALANGKPLLLPLGDRAARASTDRLLAVERAMQTVLGR